MQEHIQNELASFIANCDWEKIAPHFKEDAAYRVLDWIGCAVAGEHYPQVEIAQKYSIENGDQGNSTVIGHQTKCSPRTAAFLNGIAGHVCELDDGHRTAIGHPGSIAVPTALALGEHLNASGADVLKAVILGYEVFSRLGRTVNPSHYRTWHTTGTCGTIAAAAAAASLLKLSAEETNNAIGIAATMAGGLVESFGSHAKAINIAEACQNGIDAASLAKLGLTGSHSALLGKKGFVAATCTEPHTENLTHLSEDALVSDSAFYKVYSSCGHTNSPLDVLFKLMAKYAINPKEIERIDVATYKVAFDLTSQLKTATEDEAKFSLPFCFAISLLKGSVSLANFSQAVRTDAEVLDLARRVHVIESPEATSRFPHRQAEVSIVMKDGMVYADKTLDAHDSTTPEQIVAKFEAAVNEMDASKRQHIIQFVIDLGKQKSVAPLMDLLA